MHALYISQLTVFVEDISVQSLARTYAFHTLPCFITNKEICAYENHTSFMSSFTHWSIYSDHMGDTFIRIVIFKKLTVHSYIFHTFTIYSYVFHMFT